MHVGRMVESGPGSFRAGPKLPRSLRLLWAVAVASCCWLWSVAAPAQLRVPELAPPAPDQSALFGRPLSRVEVRVAGARWRGVVPTVRAEAGQLLSPELVRRSLDELL